MPLRSLSRKGLPLPTVVLRVSWTSMSFSTSLFLSFHGKLAVMVFSFFFFSFSTRILNSINANIR